MMHKIMYTFTVLKIRMKISFSACIENKTIHELFLNAIINSYHERIKHKLVANPYPSIPVRVVENIGKASLKKITADNLAAESEEIHHDQVKPQVNDGKKDETNKLSTFAARILQKNGAGDIFEAHGHSDEDSDTSVKLFEKSVKYKDLYKTKEATKPVRTRINMTE